MTKKKKIRCASNSMNILIFSFDVFSNGNFNLTRDLYNTEFITEIETKQNQT